MCWRRVMTKTELVIIAQYSLAAPTCDGASTPTAQTRNGSLLGARNEQYNQDFFLEIPSAQPLVDGLRLTLPQPVNHGHDKQVTAYALSALAFLSRRA